jgi:superfamily II DNA or RNA helicase
LGLINEEKRIIQLEALQALRDNNFKGVVILPTGTGKSYVLIEALRELYKPGMSVLYTCDSQRLRDSDFNNELIKWGASEFIDKITKECYKSAYKRENEHFNILLADEGDYGLTPQYSKLFFANKFDYVIFVSATLSKEKIALAKDIAPIVYQRRLKEIEERKVINKSQFYLVPYLLNRAENERYLSFNKKFHKLLQYEDSKWRAQQLKFLSFERLHFLAGLDSSVYICNRLRGEIMFNNNASRILTFCGLTRQADRICPYSYHGENEEEDNLTRFNSGMINELAVVGKVDRGLNLDGVDNIIMEHCTRSETKAIQKTGRGRRLDVDDELTVYFPIPYYKREWDRNTHYPTVVLSKVREACRNIGIENAKTYIVKH